MGATSGLNSLKHPHRHFTNRSKYMADIRYPKIDLTEVKGVLIDIDNTLYTYDPMHEEALERCYADYQHITINKSLLPVSSTDYKGQYREARNAVTERLRPSGACRSRLLAFQKLYESLNVSGSYSVATRHSDLYWSTFYERMQLASDAEDFLKECTQRSIPLCVVTDMLMNVQVRKLEALGLSQQIPLMVSSEETGKEKPAAIMFQTALMKLHLRPEEVIMIGDSEAKDIKGAESLGIKSYKVEVITL